MVPAYSEKLVFSSVSLRKEHRCLDHSSFKPLGSISVAFDRSQSKAVARRQPHRLKEKYKASAGEILLNAFTLFRHQGLHVAVQPWETWVKGRPCSLQSQSATPRGCSALGDMGEGETLLLAEPVCLLSALMLSPPNGGRSSLLGSPCGLEDEYLTTMEMRLFKNIFLKTFFSALPL